MTQTQVPPKAELLDLLRSSGEQVVSRLRRVPAHEFERGRYENGWNGRQILAHIASIEWTYPRLIEVAREGPAPATAPSEARRTPPQAGAGVATRPMRGGVDDYNARQVEKRASASVAELLAEFETNRAATVSAVEGADEELLRSTVRSAGGITGPLAGVIRLIAVDHVLVHLRDISG